MKTLNLKNYQLNVIGKALNYPMKFQTGRVKNQFVKLLAEKAELMEKSRIEMLKQLCEKDTDGKEIIEANNYKFTEKNQKKFNEEYEKLVQEVCSIDILPSLEPVISEVKQMINNSTVELQSYEVNTIEEVLKAFDEVSPSTKAKKK